MANVGKTGLDACHVNRLQIDRTRIKREREKIFLDLVHIDQGRRRAWHYSRESLYNKAHIEECTHTAERDGKKKKEGGGECQIASITTTAIGLPGAAFSTVHCTNVKQYFPRPANPSVCACGALYKYNRMQQHLALNPHTAVAVWHSLLFYLFSFCFL